MVKLRSYKHLVRQMICDALPRYLKQEIVLLEGAVDNIG